MKMTNSMVLGMLACATVCGVSCGDPAPVPAKQPAAAPSGQGAPATQPVPAAQPTPAAIPPAAPPAEEATCLGPHGEKHTFPLKVYDENADGFKTIQDAMAQAKTENKRVLVMWGENWCQFCLFLEDVLQNDTGVAPIVKSDYVWVRVDFGRGFSKGIIKHQAMADSYGVEQLKTRKASGQGMGAPALCIIDPLTGQTVGPMDPVRECPAGVLGGNDMVAKPLTMQRMFDEKLIKEWLVTWRPAAKPATGAMNEARMVAKRDSRKILALFTFPNDDACEKMSGWLARPEVAAAIGNTFTVLRVDTERMIGGREMLAEAAGKPVLPPFMCTLDADGKPAGGAAGQITNMPKTDAEIEAFIKALSASAKIGDADKAVLVKSLKDAAMAPEPKKP